MHIRDHFARAEGPTLSFEFFPPKTEEARIKLHAAIDELALAEPEFISLTYGAGGSTRDATRALVRHVKDHTRLDPVPHFTCVGHREKEIDRILHDYASMGVDNLLALRGDTPRDRPGHDHGRDFCRHAADLVRHIRRFNEDGSHARPEGFGIGVAGFPEGHPATPNRFLEMDHLKAKVDAGADYICTQLFFDNRDFFDFVDRCEIAGIRVPILAGIIPIISLTGLMRMAELAGGARVPAPLLRQFLKAADDPQAVREIGIRHASEQSGGLLAGGVAGIHYYTLNQSGPIREVLENVSWYRGRRGRIAEVPTPPSLKGLKMRCF